MSAASTRGTYNRVPEDPLLHCVAAPILTPILAAIGPGAIDDLVLVFNGVLGLVLRLFLLFLVVVLVLFSLLVRFFLLLLRFFLLLFAIRLSQGDQRDAQHPQPCQERASA